ncbi:hypothetical protein GCM10009642_63950 [Nocardiopsis metallicus]
MTGMDKFTPGKGRVYGTVLIDAEPQNPCQNLSFSSHGLPRCVGGLWPPMLSRNALTETSNRGTT